HLRRWGHGTIWRPAGRLGRATGAGAPDWATGAASCWEPVVMEEETHLKNAFSWAGSRPESETTVSVMRFRTSVGAPAPAAQAMMLAARLAFRASASFSQPPSGWPSVMRKTSGL